MNNNYSEISAMLEVATKENVATAIDQAIENDLEQRRFRNEQREKMMKLVERRVFDLTVDWDEFQERLWNMAGGCDHNTTEAKRALAEVGLDKRAIETCILYFAEVGGHCDCEIALNVDMSNPRPRCDFRCHDCGNDFDESYIVHDEVWNAAGLSRDGGLLCVGCLENRIGRRLSPDDFTDVPLNTDPHFRRSMRLQERLGGQAGEIVEYSS